MLNCEEEYINPKKSKDHFSSYLSEYFEGNYEVNDSNLSNLKNKFDYVIDCSWGGIKNYLPETIFYEACLVLIYKSTLKEKVGLTIMDGKLFSIFPYIDNLYTISSVKETPISIHHSQLDAYKSCDNLIKDNSSLQDKINKFETEVLSVYPSFKEYFKFSYPQISVKTKFKSKLDSRLVESFRENNLISIYSGKIDTVFFAEDIINKEVFDE